MIELRNYQRKAIKELTEKVSGFLNKSERAVVTFKSPTGSGKTLMVSELLKNIAVSENSNVCFVWISVRKLHEQSKDKLEKYFEDLKLIKCSYFTDLMDRKIDRNEILFINWDSINKKDKNIMIRENELDNNLSSVINNTKDEGRQIIMVIDESHHTANSEYSLELINIISPDITIEVSATPISKTYDVDTQVGRVEIKLSDVIDEEMIKREVQVNPEFLKINIDNQTSDEIVLDEAVKKRDELAELYSNEGSIINPLLLIQLPDNKDSKSQGKLDDIRKYLDTKFNISVSNNTLAIWLSEKKSDNLANIEKNDNEVKVLIFKQAISVGWDCPRASILVIFRQISNFRFTIQTVGRIMRMPEFRYYKNEELNCAYVFTNVDQITIDEGEAKEYFTVMESFRRKEYEKIKLRSVYLRRQRERTRLSGDFVKIFQKTAYEIKLSDKLNLNPGTITDLVIAEGKISELDKPGQIVYKGQIEIPSSPIELSEKFDMFIRKNASPYAMADSSDRIKSAIYTFLKENHQIEKYSLEAQKIVLGVDNTNKFEECLQRSKDEYQKEVIEKLRSDSVFFENKEWEIPVIITYNEKYFPSVVNKSIMSPFFIYRDASKPEKGFIRILENSQNVLWWFKNREDEPKYFSVGYTNSDGFKASFYVDFIVMLNDGRIGLFDTKKGSTASNQNAKEKAEALQEYIRTENNRGKNLFGGIVVPVGEGEMSWKINSSVIYSDDLNDISQWKNFHL